MDLVAEIKQRLTAREVFEFYGFHPNRSGFVRCMFHGERTGSLKVYAGQGGYHCFGCGKHGDVISFVTDYFGLSFFDAIKKLDTDFSLGLPLDNKLPERKRMEIAKQAFLRKKEEEKKLAERRRVEDGFFEAFSAFAAADNAKTQFHPKKHNGEIFPEYIESLHKIEYARYALDRKETELFLYEQSRNDQRP